MTYDTIISAQELASHLSDSGWQVIDCRFDLANSESGYNQYLSAHIPGAAYAHLDRDLSGPKTPVTGRHPLPEAYSFRETCSLLGISDGTQVVVYDAVGGAFASRLWWLLQDYGHKPVAVLDGGWQAWQAEGRPVKSGSEIPISGVFTGIPGHMPLATTAEVEQETSHPGACLIDARSPERFSGQQELIDPVAGHIPNAVNRFHGLNLEERGHFKPPETLRSEFSVLMAGHDPTHIAVYCGSGVTSCHHVLAMKIAGMPLPKLYAGSWSEWIRDPGHKIITG